MFCTSILSCRKLQLGDTTKVALLQELPMLTGRWTTYSQEKKKGKVVISQLKHYTSRCVPSWECFLLMSDNVFFFSLLRWSSWSERTLCVFYCRRQNSIYNTKHVFLFSFFFFIQLDFITVNSRASGEAENEHFRGLLRNTSKRGAQVSRLWLYSHISQTSHVRV